MADNKEYMKANANRAPVGPEDQSEAHTKTAGPGTLQTTTEVWAKGQGLEVSVGVCSWHTKSSYDSFENRT